MDFLKELWDILDRQTADRKSLRLLGAPSTNSVIREFDISAAVEDAYRANLKALLRFKQGGDGEPETVVLKIRPVMERYCRNMQPLEFSERDLLGAIVGRIRTAGNTHPLWDVVPELEEINTYCRRYHHDDGTLVPGQINAQELQSFVRRALDLAGIN